MGEVVERSETGEGEEIAFCPLTALSRCGCLCLSDACAVFCVGRILSAARPRRDVEQSLVLETALHKTL